MKLHITLTVVRGVGKSCEPFCPQWIAAEGRITSKTPALFRKVLKGLGKTKLPVLLDSLGGDLDAAIEMGMLIRDEKLPVAVASTGYLNCDPRTLYCFNGKKQKGPYKGFAVYA